MKTRKIGKCVDVCTDYIFKDKKVMIKGCSEVPVPTWAYLIISSHLSNYAKNIYFGEPCSAIQIYNRKD